MRILNLGAGVQSTAVFLMAHEGRIPPIDHAIFADTQEEPQAVYDHLEWMKRIPAPVPLMHIATAGKLGDHLVHGTDSAGGRFASIPAFTHTHHDTPRAACSEGMVRRQCTKEYKVDVIERVIRRVIIGLLPRARIPKDFKCEQIIGISLDEKGRAKRIKARFEDRPWARVSFPLIEMAWTRADCLDYLKTRVPHVVTRSACVFCPFKSASEWLRTKENAVEWARVIEIDEALRKPGNVVNRNMEQSLYLHRTCLPMVQIDFEKEAEKEAKRNARPLFDLMECEGMCGM